MTRWQTCMIALSLAIAARPAAAQAPAVVRGQVVDAASGNAIAGAVVHVGDRNLGVSDAQGRFTVSRLAAGEYTVWATAMGYDMGSAELEVPFDSITVTLALEANPVRLEAIVATASRFESRTRAYPRSVNVFREQQIRNAASSNVADFVITRAMLRRGGCGMGEACAMIRGRLQPVVVIVDEVRLMGGLEILSTFQTWQIARVEVFNGGGEVRVYTKSFLEWAARTNYRPLPLFLAR